MRSSSSKRAESFVAAGEVDDGKEGGLFALHGFVVDAQGAEELGAAGFEVDEVVGVVDDAHLVGFGVTDSDSVVVGA